MSRHWLVTLVGFCMVGLAAPTWAGRMTATQGGEVTEILNPDFALDYVVGTPVTMVAEWDTNDFIDMAEFGWVPGFFGSRPTNSFSWTISFHWLEQQRGCLRLVGDS